MDVQRKRFCDHCSLIFGLSEKRYEFEGQVVHKEPCLTTLQNRANLRIQRVIERGVNREADLLHPL